MSNVIFDYSKLRGKIKEIYGNQTHFAKDLGISHVSLSAKLNNKVGFSQSEIIMACNLLEISKEDLRLYFFRKVVQKTEPSEEEE